MQFNTPHSPFVTTETYESSLGRQPKLRPRKMKRLAQTQPGHNRWASVLPSHPILLLVIPVGSLEGPLALDQLGQVWVTEATAGFQLRKANIRF